MTIGGNYLIGFFIIEIPFNISRKWVKINQYPTLLLQESHIIEQLSAMVACYIRYCLALNHNIIFANEIHTKCCLERNSTILRME